MDTKTSLDSLDISHYHRLKSKMICDHWIYSLSGYLIRTQHVGIRASTGSHLVYDLFHLFLKIIILHLCGLCFKQKILVTLWHRDSLMLPFISSKCKSFLTSSFVTFGKKDSDTIIWLLDEQKFSLFLGLSALLIQLFFSLSNFLIGSFRQKWSKMEK